MASWLLKKRKQSSNSSIFVISLRTFRSSVLRGIFKTGGHTLSRRLLSRPASPAALQEQTSSGPADMERLMPDGCIGSAGCCFCKKPQKTCNFILHKPQEGASTMMTRIQRNHSGLNFVEYCYHGLIFVYAKPQQGGFMIHAT